MKDYNKATKGINVDMLIQSIYHKNPITISEDTTVGEAIGLLSDHKFNGLLVLDNNKQVVGVLSLQDIAAATIPYEMRQHLNLAAAMFKPGYFNEASNELKNQKVKSIMRKDFIKVTPQSSIMEIMADFLKNDLYIVPVYENDLLAGIITRSEIKQALATAMGVNN